MWIMSQDRMGIINSDSVRGFKVSNTSYSIEAIVNTQSEFILGSYDSLKDAKDVLAGILLAIANDASYVSLPDINYVGDWTKEFESVLKGSR